MFRNMKTHVATFVILSFLLSVLCIPGCNSDPTPVHDGHIVMKSTNAVPGTPEEASNGVFVLTNDMSSTDFNTELKALVDYANTSDLVDRIDREIFVDMNGYTVWRDSIAAQWVKVAQRDTYISNGTFRPMKGFEDLKEPLLTGNVGRGLGIGGWNGSAGDIDVYMDAIHLDNVAFIRGVDTQLEIIGTSMSTIEDCKFEYGNIGAECTFALQTHFDRCRFLFQREIGLVLQSGSGRDETDVTDDPLNGANVKNSQSNHSTVKNCRFLSELRDNDYRPFAGLASFGNNGVVTADCVFEGRSYTYPIYSDYQNSNNSVIFTIVRPHIEFSKPDEIEAVAMLSAATMAKVEGWYSQVGCPQFEINAKPATYVVIDCPAYLPSAGDRPSLIPNGCRNVSMRNVFQWQRWTDPDTYGGDMPQNLLVESNGNFYGNSYAPGMYTKDGHGITILSSNEYSAQVHLGTRDKRGSLILFKNGTKEAY